LGGSFYTKVSLADIDGDGDLDLFCGGGGTGTFVYFENVGSAQVPSFQLRHEEFPGLGSIGAYSGSRDADFADLDADGDLDAGVSYALDGGGAIYWNDGTAQQAAFAYRPPYGPLNIQGSPTLVDIDADGDLDYFGGAGYRDFQLEFSENVGTDSLPEFVTRTRHYQNLFLGLPFCFDMADLDADGDVDMLSCREGGAVYYWENRGRPDSAAFVRADSNYLAFRDTTDWLESPELADIDADGDLDLFLAGGYAHLYFFENAGTPQAAHYEQRYDTTLFYNFRWYNNSLLSGAGDIDADGDFDLAVGNGLLINESAGGELHFLRRGNCMPPYLGALGDLDADGDLDYVCVGSPSAPGYFENTGGPAWPAWADGRDLFPPDGHLTNPFGVALADLDADGDLDLYVVHAGSQRFATYRNDGTPQSYNFTFTGEIALPEYELVNYTGIYFADMDRDWDYDLLVADMVPSEWRPVHVRLFYYRNDGGPFAPAWTFVTNDYGRIISGHRQGGVTVSPVDVDGDLDLDLFISASMGLQLYLNPLNPMDAINDESYPSPDRITLSCYPNPFNAATTITVNGTAATEIAVYDIAGRRVALLQTEGGRTVWEARELGSGVYFARAVGLESGKGQMGTSTAYAIKLIYLK
jgi:hypothetical protein